ncbi:MAG: hypothetical protein EA398_02040 [Deltaproteobacteria bacterium]|nr:MAG: hypothetical protein EA398_02040 [Deltaproteobacteria bacterium]
MFENRPLWMGCATALVLMLVVNGCGDSSPGTDPETEPGGLSCATDFDCPFGRCSGGVCVSDSTDGVGSSFSGSSDVSDGPNADVGSTAAGPDASEGQSGGPSEVQLYRRCTSDSDCPVVGTRCLVELPVNREVFDTTNAGWQRFIPVTSIVRASPPAGQPAGDGVCSLDCAVEGPSVCDAIIDEEPWTCHVVEKVDVYDGPEQGAPTPERLADLAAGAPFYALCRPPSSRLGAAGASLCAPCDRDEDCGDGPPGRCMSEELTTGEFSPGFCAVEASLLSGSCPAGFEIREGFCVPSLGGCLGCVDLDGNGRGVGHCPNPGVDCDDLDPTVYFAEGRVPPRSLCDRSDRNCNQRWDDEEMVGPDGTAPLQHCRECDDPCTDEGIGLESDAPNVGAECRYENDEPMCLPGCASGWANCDEDLDSGCETDLGAETNCGACGIECAALPGVDSASCVDFGDDPDRPAAERGPYGCAIVLCDPGRASCDGDANTGCEVNVLGDVDHCGACGQACPSVVNGEPACEAGQCVVGSCDGTTASCDGDFATGCETDVGTAVRNCGACGNDCMGPNVAEASCEGGDCRIEACVSGWGECDDNPSTGCETDLLTAEAHCGSCGNDCGALPNVAATSCVNGSCAITECQPLFANCDGEVATGCETPLDTDSNCGGCGNACTDDDFPGPLGSQCQVDGDTASCACVDAPGTDGRQLCNGEYSLCGQDIDEGCPAALHPAADAYRMRFENLQCAGQTSCSPTAIRTDCTSVGGRVEEAGICRSCNAEAIGGGQEVDHSCPQSARGFLRALHVKEWGSRPTLASQGAVFGPAVQGIEFEWYRFEDRLALEPVPGAPASGDHARYRISGSAESEGVREGAVGTMSGSGNTWTLSCNESAGELPVSIAFILDDFRRLNAVALGCHAFELRRVRNAINPVDRYRLEPVGAPRWVFPQSHWPLLTEEILDRQAGSCSGILLAGSAWPYEGDDNGSRLRAYAGPRQRGMCDVPIVPLAGGVRALVRTETSAGVSFPTILRFQYGFLASTAGEDLRLDVR